jgi:hypothetical protein
MLDGELIIESNEVGLPELFNRCDDRHKVLVECIPLLCAPPEVTSDLVLRYPSQALPPYLYLCLEQGIISIVDSLGDLCIQDTESSFCDRPQREPFKGIESATNVGKSELRCYYRSPAFAT